MERSDRRSWDRLAGICGILAAVFGFVGFGLLATSDAFIPLGASPDDVADAVASAAPWQTFAGQFLELIGQMLLLLFAVGLWDLLRRQEPDPSWLPTAALAGAVLWLGVVAGAVVAEYGVALGAGEGLGVEGAWALHFLNVAFYVSSWGFSGFFMAVVGVTVLRVGVLPRWLGWVALVLALANLVSLAVPTADFSQIAPNFIGLWLIAASVALLLRTRRPRVARDAAAPRPT